MAAPDGILLDTGPLVGFLDESDQWHEWSVARFNELPGPMVTCEAVVSEAVYLLGGGVAAVRIFEMVELGALEVVPLLPREAGRIRAFMSRYGERAQLADACIVRLSELHPRRRVLTTDGRGFGVYRRNRDEPIPLIAP
jgi:predicted nucleic acid-binding protein